MKEKASRSSSGRDISTISESEKLSLSHFIFYNHPQAAIAGATDIHLCFEQDADEAHRLSFAQLIRGNHWLRANGFRIREKTPVRIANN